MRIALLCAAALMAASPAVAESPARVTAPVATTKIEPGVRQIVEDTDFDHLALKKEVEALKAEVAALKAELKKIDDITNQLNGVDVSLNNRIEQNKAAISALTLVSQNFDAFKAVYEKHTHTYRRNKTWGLEVGACDSPGLGDPIPCVTHVNAAWGPAPTSPPEVAD